MTRTFVKSIVAAGALAGLMLCTAGVAQPAGTPPKAHDPRKPAKPVVFFNQGQFVAEGLTPAAAIERARRFEPYPISAVHYTPKGFHLVAITVYPYIPGQLEPQDTELFMNMSAARTPTRSRTRPAAAPSFELDHQFGSPYAYANGDAYFTVEKVKLAGRTVNVAEQKVGASRLHKAIDLIFVYWYDSKHKVATEVTTELLTSHLSRAEVLKIAASVS